jgi:hypothetical protein
VVLSQLLYIGMFLGTPVVLGVFENFPRLVFLFAGLAREPNSDCLAGVETISNIASQIAHCILMSSYRQVWGRKAIRRAKKLIIGPR